MKGFKRIQLGNVAELITKGTTPTTLGYDFQDEGINFLKIECFDENGELIPEKVAFISDECNEKLKRSQLKAGDILFSIAGAIGRVASVTDGMLPANTNQALAIIRITDENVYLPYIKLILTSPIVKRQFENKKQGVAQLNLSLKDINEIVIPLPDRKRQEEYAELFEKLYKVIALRNTQLSNMDNLIKARFVEMFGDQEFEKKQLIELIQKGAGLSYGIVVPGENVADGIPMVRPSDFKNGRLNLENVYRVASDIECKYKKTRLVGDEILVQVIGQPGQVMLSDERCKGMNVTRNLAVIRIDNVKVNRIYISHYLTTEEAQRFMFGSTNQSTLKQLPLNKLKELPVPLVPLSEQEQFADFVKQVDKSKVIVLKMLL